MSKVIEKIIGAPSVPKNDFAEAFAPTNIALCKYWGKRDTELNLPITSSLSVSLPPKGTRTTISLCDHNEIYLNNEKISHETPFAKKLIDYLNLFRTKDTPGFRIETENNIPVAAGLASSASGFAALAKALDQLYGWQLESKELSILARLGSGSACRSLWNGFVQWQRGDDPLGFDSHGVPLDFDWPELCIGIITLCDKEKPHSSRQAMEQTVKSSLLYKAWPEQVNHDLSAIKEALANKDFTQLGRYSEQNANAMHATLMASWPPITYHLPQTLETMEQIWRLRNQGIEVYYTQDAGPNLKLLFLEKDRKQVLQNINCCDIVAPFNN